MFRFIKKLNRNITKLSEKGFSVAEIMVATAILGVVSVAIVSQLKLSVRSGTSSESDAQITSITNKIISSIGVARVCIENFGGDAVGGAYAQLVDGGVAFATAGASYGNEPEIDVVSSKSSEIQLTAINTRPVNANEMVLELSFRKKAAGIAGFLANIVKKEIPINIAVTAGTISYCSTNFDLVIKTAIEQSCKGNAARYDATIDPPYGSCVHDVLPVPPNTCPGATFLSKVATAVGLVSYDTCVEVTKNCLDPINQVLIGYNASGDPICDHVLPTCASGQVVVKNSAGQHVCSTIDCSLQPVYSAFTGFTAAGAPICTPITNTTGCPPGQYTTQISASGNIVCSSALLTASSCPTGSLVQGISAAGSVVCAPFITLPFSCPGGQGATGIDASGNVTCQVLRRPLACNGSGSSHSYAQCTGAGGTVINAETPTSHCLFTGATCPGGWSPCQNFGRQVGTSCNDSSNTYYCNSYRVFGRPVPPANGGLYGNFPINTFSCTRWTGASGNGKSCAPVADPPTSATRDQIGCY